MSSQQPETKKCPYCSEEILADAKKCKHCGEFLDQKHVRNLKGLKPSIFNGLRVKICCPNCEYEGKPKQHRDGSSAVELVLWLCFLLPGLLYTLWRDSTIRYVCPKCGCKEISKI